MLLLIDNYDSFTYNLVQYFESLGQQVKVYRNDCIDAEQALALNPDYVVISPGPGTPDEAGCSMAIVKAFFHHRPILGICLGHQCLAQSSGAKITQANNIIHGKVSRIYHERRRLFAAIPQSYQATRYHSLAVACDTLPSCWDITAWSQDEADNFEEIMAINHRRLPLYGVQFHPEAILTEYGHQLLKNFLDMKI